MRTAILTASGCCALFFAVSLALTFLARGYIIGLARDFVIDRTQKLAEPAVEIDVRGRREKASVVKLPFYRRKKS